MTWSEDTDLSDWKHALWYFLLCKPHLDPLVRLATAAVNRLTTS